MSGFIADLSHPQPIHGRIQAAQKRALRIKLIAKNQTETKSVV